MTFDVIIIGTGQAGVPLATKLAAAGKRVLIAERGAAGGTCSNTGCTPTKTMIASARAAHVARTAGRLGVRVGDVRVDFPAVVARKDAIVARWRTGVERRLQADQITFVRGHARFVGAREVEVAGARHQAETIVINVGARPVVPPVPGLADVPWLDNRQVMALPELPAHLLVLGGGYIGCELGQMFRRLGARGDDPPARRAPAPQPGRGALGGARPRVRERRDHAGPGRRGAAASPRRRARSP